MKRPALLALLTIGWLLAGQSCIQFSSGPGADPTMWRSDDHGISWNGKDFVSQVVEKKKTRTIAITNVSASNLVFSRLHPEKGFLLTDASGAYVTANRGDQWTQLGYNQFVRGFGIDSIDDNVLYVSGGLTIKKSTDGGGVWADKFTITKPDELLVGMAIDFFDPKRLLAVSSLGVVYLSDDAAETWRIIATIEDTLTGLTASPADSRVFFAYGTNEALWRSTDGGATWRTLKETFTDFDQATTGLNLTFVGETNTVYATSAYGLLRSTNLGDTWGTVRTLLPPPTRIEFVNVDPRNQQRISFVTAGKLHRTDDGGANWEVSALPMRRPIAFLVADPIDPNILYIGTKIPPK